jgi:hypothetical protein
MKPIAEGLERLTANVEVATVLSSIPASSDTVSADDEAVFNKVMQKSKKKHLKILSPKGWDFADFYV